MTTSHLVFLADNPESPAEKMPREKMDEFGVEALSSWELLALLLRVGTRSKSHSEDVVSLAKRLISEFGFRGIFSQFSAARIQESAGVYEHHARTIVAVSEISRRLNGKFEEFDASDMSKVAGRFDGLSKIKQEQCHVLHIDRDNKAIFSEMVAMGEGNTIFVSPREILRSALWLGAEKIIIIHNHLGSSRASKEDIIWTEKISHLLWGNFQIKVVDHIIIGRDGYFSFSEKNLL